jgi:hypothetical protein
MRSNASATAGRPSEENCAKGGRIAGPYGGEKDPRVVKAEKDLQAMEQAWEQAEASAREAPAQEAHDTGATHWQLFGGVGVAEQFEALVWRRGARARVRCV